MCLNIGQLSRKEKHLVESQGKMMTHYDKKAVERSFEPGDKVLLLLPVSGKPLSAKYTGPYRVKQKLNSLNYVIETPDRSSLDCVT